MSILSKMKSIKLPNETDSNTVLYERHPFETAALVFRLQYLSALALLTALDRDPTSDEIKAFIHLSTALGVDTSEAEDLLSERATSSEDDIETLFSALSEHQASWNYLADLAWLHSIDGQMDEHESAAFDEAMRFLGIDKKAIKGDPALALKKLMHLMHSRDTQGFVTLRDRITWPDELEAVLSAITKRMKLPPKEKVPVAPAPAGSRKVAKKKPVAKKVSPVPPAAQTTLNPQAAWPFPTASKP